MTFYVAKQEGRGHPYQTFIDGIGSPVEAVQKAQKVEAWNVVVFTSEGYIYWSSQSPEFINSEVVRQGKHTTLKLPHFEMDWVVFLRANRKEKAEKFLKRMEETLRTKIVLRLCERYFKDNSLFEIGFTTRIDTQDVREAVFSALCLGQRVLPHWTVTGPMGSDDGGLWELRGHSKDEATGPVMIDFTLRNFYHDWSGDVFDKRPPEPENS